MTSTSKVTTWVMMSIGGMALIMIGAIVGGVFALFFGLFGSFLMMMPVLIMVSIAKDRGILPIFDKLKKFEKMVFYIIDNRSMVPVIFNTRDEGILEKPRIGMIEDKGTEVFWGKVPISFAMQGTGMTLNLKDVSYTGMLGETRKIKDYENAIKQYLGPAQYGTFEKKFRQKNRVADWESIRGELKYLLKQEPHDPLAEKILGETLDFRFHLNHLLYAYDPMTAKNAIDKRVMAAEHQNLQYKQADKAMGYAKAFAVVMIVIVVVLVALQNVDLSNILGGIMPK